MKVLVCGGRDFEQMDIVCAVLDEIQPTLVIHGNARGADLLADAWAVLHHVPVVRFNALWSIHGKAAGPIRNQQMLDESKPDKVVAFPGGTGTAHMVRIAKKANIPVDEIGSMNGR